MSRFIDPIPEDKQPLESENVNYDVVYRAMYNRDVNDINNFLPTYIERNYKPESFFSREKSIFSLSVFTSEKELIAHLKPNAKKWSQVEALAKGHTDVSKGIATKDNEGHVDYYLYDYLNNNPCSDFEYVKDIDKTNEQSNGFK